jgi:NAD(P)-dependent dehydrogenase (short-subunit alcohol dehydrogenase family)
MKTTKTILVTGATRGFGLAIARELAAQKGVELVLAVRDVARGEAVAASLRRRAGPPRVRVLRLDLSSLDEVARFADAWREPLAALVNNAGRQVPGGLRLTADGFEETLAVNLLAPTWLTLGLLPWLRGGRVLNVSSGTHNPDHPLARRLGFRGGRFTSVSALARGEVEGGSERQRAATRYATSKLLVIASTQELARRHPGTTFLTIDPGAMPGTGLVRDAPLLVRLAWSTLLRWLVPVLPDASTPARSARAVRWLLTTEGLVSGEVYDFEQRPSSRVWPPARAPELGREVVDETTALLATRWPLPWSPVELAS